MWGVHRAHVSRDVLRGSLVVASVVAVWWIASLVVNVSYLPGPGVVLVAFMRSIGAGLPGHFAASLGRVAGGLGLALVLGVPAGLALGRKASVDQWTAPLVYAVFPIPKVVFLPLLILALGLGDSSKIALLFLTLFFQVLVTTRDAARGVPSWALMSIATLGANGYQVFRHVVWPWCVPAIFTALRIGIGTAIAVLFYAESFATEKGLGFFIMDAWGRADYPSMYAGMTAMSLLGLILYAVIDLLQLYACPWLKVL